MTKEINYSEGTRNPFSLLKSYISALKYGEFPVVRYCDNNELMYPPRKLNKEIKEWRNYTMAYGVPTRPIHHNIFDQWMTDNFITAFGSQEAVDNYFKTGKLSKDNFKSAGVCHPVKLDDMVNQLPDEYKRYDSPNRWYYSFAPKNATERWTTVQGKSWTIFIHTDKKEKTIFDKILLALYYPFRFIPRYRNLKMDKYTNHYFRIGGVINGFGIEIQIPKKFSYKD